MHVPVLLSAAIVEELELIAFSTEYTLFQTVILI